MATRDGGVWRQMVGVSRVWRQMVGVSRVESGNERRGESGDRWLESVELKVATRDRGVWRQMVGVSRVESGNERQGSLETDGWSQ